MNAFRRISLAAQLFLGCAAVAALTVGLSALSIGLFGQLAAAAAAATVLAATLGRSASDRLAQAGLLAGRLSEGRFDNPVQADRRDEIGQLLAQLGGLQEKLRAERDVRDAAAAAEVRARSAHRDAAAAAQAVDAQHELVSLEDTARLSAVIQGALHGNLVERIALQGRSGVLARIGAGVNELLDSMAAAIRQIQCVSAEVSRGADEISAGNSNLSQRTGEQATSLEETASSMEQMTTTVKQNAANAEQANQLAIAARGQAESGGTVVGKAVRAMSEINDSSRRIADIICVIDEIAFQTNLLALNAAVEAARAGEQGRGFAVVASEVRSLAGRSATAAKEIKELIQDSVRKVEDGSTLVTESGHTLEQIVVSVKKVSDIVAEIAAASGEQSSDIQQVNRAVMQMDELTQQNASLVAEATEASSHMAEQARSLSTMMERYQLAAATVAARPAGAAAAPKPAASSRGAARAQPGRRGADRTWSAAASPAGATAHALPTARRSSTTTSPGARTAASAPALSATGTQGAALRDWQEF